MAAVVASVVSVGVVRLTAGPSWSITSPRNGAAPSTHDVPVWQMGLFANAAGWVDNCAGIYRSTDGGAHFAKITPPDLAHVSCVSDHIDAVTTFGDSDIWVSVMNVPWLYVGSCNGCIDPPGSALDYSTNGGLTWRSTGSCYEGDCDFSSLSFSNPDDGIAMGGYLQRTTNGGKSWSLLAYGASTIGAGSGQLAEIAQMPDGEIWGSTTPSSGPGPMAGPGGAVEFSTEAHCQCQVYASPANLPRVEPYGQVPTTTAMPVWFGDAAVLATRLTDPNRSVDKLEVYISANEGHSWRVRRGPGADLSGYGSGGGFQLPFAVVNQGTWILDVGKLLFVTHDAGSTWSRETPRPTEASGTIVSIAFATPQLGWALLEQRGCGPELCTYQRYLIGTRDGGLSWVALTP